MYSIGSWFAHGRFVASVAVLSCILTAPARAGSAQGEDEFEEHHAHEHGVAALNVAVEGQRLSVEFDSPAVNVIGFEHAPRSDAERAAVKKAEGLLRNVDKALGLPGAAECRATESKVSTPEWHDGHDHADFEASYEFTCLKPAALTQLVVTFLGELAPGTKLRVQLITPAKQASVELSGKNNSLSLR